MPTATDTSATSVTAASASGRAVVLAAFRAAASTVPVSLCVGVAPLQQTSARGQASQWEVGAWTVGGNVPDARIQLRSTAGAGTPAFSVGCGSGQGTSACDLGAVNASSGQRLFQARITVPLTATTITAVSLTVTGSAANLARDPEASASVAVQASASPVAANPAGANPQLSTMPSPGSATPTATLSPGGSAAGLFPTIAPGSPQAEGETPAADVSPAAHVSTPARGITPTSSEIAQAGGLAALAAAMVLSMLRVSLRRPVPRPAANSAVAAAPLPETPETPETSAGHEQPLPRH